MKHNRFSHFCFRSLICAVALLNFTSLVNAQDVNQRKISDVEIFVNNHLGGESNGCTTGVSTKGRMTCGKPSHVSELTWTFLRSTAEGDVYSFTRKYPSDAAIPLAETKEISFNGKDLILWVDDVQKITLRIPLKSTQVK